MRRKKQAGRFSPARPEADEGTARMLWLAMSVKLMCEVALMALAGRPCWVC